MATIHIKNVGPLMDTGEIALNNLLFIIGKQSSGKSTFILSLGIYVPRLETEFRHYNNSKFSV